MMERIAALGADYVATIGALARTEAAEDAARIAAALKARAAALAVLALGAVWLNVAVLLWLMTTPYAIAGAFAIAAVALVAGFTMSAGARRAAAGLRPMQATRRVLAAEFSGSDPAVVHPPAPPMRADEASARLRDIRTELRETVALHRGPQGEPIDEPAVASFEPRSRTMRTVMWLWRVIPRVPAGTAVTSVLGLAALGSPKLRRLLAVVALLRNLGGHPRGAPHGGASSLP